MKDTRHTSRDSAGRKRQRSLSEKDGAARWECCSEENVTAAAESPLVVECFNEGAAGGFQRRGHAGTDSEQDGPVSRLLLTLSILHSDRK